VQRKKGAGQNFSGEKHIMKCIICGSDESRIIASRIREGPGTIRQCSSCGLIFQDISQTLEQLKQYYNAEYQKTNSLDLSREQTPREHFDDSILSKQPILDTIIPYLRADMSVLDVGCGAGELLYKIRPHVREVVGVELNQGFVDFINQDLGIEAYAEDLNQIDFGGRKFDFILCINALDHMPNPHDTLATITSLLKPGGIVYLEVPNTEEALNVYLPEPNRSEYNTFFWHKAHFFYFTQQTLRKFLEKYGFESRITSSHKYTIKNFLQWYYLGSPQRSFREATTGHSLFAGNRPFEKKMNTLFEQVDLQFRQILADTVSGDTLCCIAQRKGEHQP
jgi:2-polyprenyl-3-methyl-5-hydroxy-6-metoxy-1,4-benzoquinol methylase